MFDQRRVGIPQLEFRCSTNTDRTKVLIVMDQNRWAIVDNSKLRWPRSFSGLDRPRPFYPSGRNATHLEAVTCGPWGTASEQGSVSRERGRTLDKALNHIALHRRVR